MTTCCGVPVQCMKWLEDQVFSIREAATKNLQQLASEFGPEWAKEHLVPQVLHLMTPSTSQPLKLLFVLTCRRHIMLESATSDIVCSNGDLLLLMAEACQSSSLIPKITGVTLHSQSTAPRSA